MTTAIDPALNLARQTLYRCCGWVFADPASGEWESLLTPATQAAVLASAELLREASVAPEETGRGERPVAELDASGLFERLPRTRDAVNAQYEQTFGLLATSPNPPYETEYIGPKQTFQRSQHLADVAGFYRAFGLSCSRERPDHVAIELEFMALVIGLEHQAATHSDKHRSPAERENHVAVCQRAQSRFLREHIAWWFPTLARLMEIEAPETMYAAAGRLMCALLPLERARFNLPACEPADGPVPIEQPDACAGCLLQPDL